MAEPPPSAAAPRQPAACYQMVSIPFAQAAALDAVAAPLPSVAVPLQQALGRVMAEDLVATSPLPPFAASIKDGYAVRSRELEDAVSKSSSSSGGGGGAGDGDEALVFPVAFEALAGASPPPLPPNSVAYISTGAPLPEGADAVVQIEDTELVVVVEEGEGKGEGEGGGARRSPRAPSVLFRSLRDGRTRAPRPGEDVRAPGSDLSPGDVVLARGERVGPAEVGLAATVGVGALRVGARPLVAVLSTGDELAAAGEAPADDCLAPPSEPLPPGAIRDANRPLLLAAAGAEGCDVIDLGVAADCEAQTEAAVERALSAGAHVLVVSGGVSMGDRDFVKPALERRGTVHFGRVNMKPGKPLTFATLPRRGEGELPPLLAFGLPGNPASAAVTFALVVAPVLRKLAGWPRPLPRRLGVELDRDTRTDAQRPEYARAAVRWEGAGGAGGGEREGGGGGGEAGGAEGSGSSGVGGGRFLATNTGNQISSRLLSMKGADVLLELPAGAGVMRSGTVVSALLYGDLRAMK